MVPVKGSFSYQIINKYRHVSWLPLSSIIFEKLVFNAIFKLIIENNFKVVFTYFKLNNSFINQPSQKKFIIS